MTGNEISFKSIRLNLGTDCTQIKSRDSAGHFRRAKSGTACAQFKTDFPKKKNVWARAEES